MTAKTALILGCVSALLAVVIGAFGAHGLKGRLDEYGLSVFEIGVRYQFYHALALVLLGLSTRVLNHGATAPAAAFLVGTVVFSGSLYLLAISQARWLGAVTPFGGVAFIAGWIMWIVAVARS